MSNRFTAIEDALASRSRWFLLIALLAVIAISRVAATYGVFNQTFDEPVHLAGGMEWLDRGTISTTVYNPPLGRVLFALGPHMDGARYQPGEATESGNAALYSGTYVRRLTLARSGNLLFFLLAMLGVALWAWRTQSATSAVIAVLVFSTSAPVLGHAGVATLDLACVAGTTFSLVAFLYWLERPGARSALIVGLALGLAIACKISVLFFFGPSAAVFLVLRIIETGKLPAAPRNLAGHFAIVAMSVALVVWAVYRFSVAPPEQGPNLVLDDSPLRPVLQWTASHGIPIPAPSFVAGVAMLIAINEHGTYPSYFLGNVSLSGHRLFYPTVFAVKSSIPLLLLLVLSCAIALPRLRRKEWIAASGFVATVVILLSSFLFRIDGGIRYILPVYAAASVAAAFAVVWMIRSERLWPAVLALLLLLIHVTESATAHPDYLAHFNAFAGRHPEKITIDSDLDWGQDLLRLAEVSRRLGIREMSIAYFGTAVPELHAIAPALHRLRPNERASGWVAVSEIYCAPIWTDGYLWLTKYRPEMIVGKSIRLYRIPPPR